MIVWVCVFHGIRIYKLVVYLGFSQEEVCIFLEVTNLRVVPSSTLGCFGFLQG